MLERLAAWLDYRTERWPNTCNPHLFINVRTALRTTPVSNQYLLQTLGVTVKALREDRILHEAIVSGGDVRRLCDMFGISVHSAYRYTSTLGHPDLETRVSRASRAR